MKRGKISNNVIRRLPRYLHFLNDLSYHGVVRVSSGEMASQMGLNASQIRQDFSCFGEFGQQGYGYNVEMLRQEIASILGADQKRSAILVGAGKLGQTLMGNFDFESCGFVLKAAFDIRTDLVGASVSQVPIYHIDFLQDFIRDHQPALAVLTVPRRIAVETANAVADAGVRGIWNFTNISLNVAKSDVIVEDIHFSDSLLSLSYYLKESERDAGEPKGTPT